MHRQQRAALDTRREEALRGYLRQMSELMLDRGLLGSKPDADVREVARTITLTTVRRLDSQRKGSVVIFLTEARLLHSEKPGSEPTDYPKGVVDLYGADLHSADLSHAGLNDLTITDVNLRRADLAVCTMLS